MIWEANRISERSEEHSSGITLLKIASQTRTVFLKNDQYWTQNVATATQHQLLVDTCAAPTAINSGASSSSSLLKKLSLGPRLNSVPAIQLQGRLRKWMSASVKFRERTYFPPKRNTSQTLKVVKMQKGTHCYQKKPAVANIGRDGLVD